MGEPGATQMLPCSDLAEMPEACDLCLEYWLCIAWPVYSVPASQTRVRQCYGI